MPEINKEIKTWRYWAHIFTISAIVLFILENSQSLLHLSFSGLHFSGTMFNLKNALLSTPLIGLGDWIAENIWFR